MTVATEINILSGVRKVSSSQHPIVRPLSLRQRHDATEVSSGSVIPDFDHLYFHSEVSLPCLERNFLRYTSTLNKTIAVYYIKFTILLIIMLQVTRAIKT